MRLWGHSICKLDRQLGTWEDKLLGISRGRQRGRQWGISRGRQRDISQGEPGRHVLRKVSGNVAHGIQVCTLVYSAELLVQPKHPKHKLMQQSRKKNPS